MRLGESARGHLISPSRDLPRSPIVLPLAPRASRVPADVVHLFRSELTPVLSSRAAQGEVNPSREQMTATRSRADRTARELRPCARTCVPRACARAAWLGCFTSHDEGGCHRCCRNLYLYIVHVLITRHGPTGGMRTV